MKIRVAYTGRGYESARHFPEELALHEGATVDDALQRLEEHLPAGERLPESCLVAVAGTHLGTIKQHAAHELSDGEELVLIAPVAGGC